MRRWDSYRDPLNSTGIIGAQPVPLLLHRCLAYDLKGWSGLARLGAQLQLLLELLVCVCIWSRNVLVRPRSGSNHICLMTQALNRCSKSKARPSYRSQESPTTLYLPILGQYKQEVSHISSTAPKFQVSTSEVSWFFLFNLILEFVHVSSSLIAKIL